MAPKYGKGEAAERPRPKPLTQDEYLRGFGFRIAARPAGQPAIWRSPDGALLCEATAVEACRQKVREVETCGKAGSG